MQYVFVHGIAQGGRSADELKLEWLNALNQGLADSNHVAATTVTVPYYGDRLDFWCDPENATRGGRRSDFNAFALDYFSEAIAKAPASALEAGLASPVGRPGDESDDATRDFQNNRIITGVVRALDGGLPFLSSRFISRFLKSVHTYLTVEEARSEIDQIVLTGIQQSPDPVTLVGHSLGSVVAYNILRSRTLPNVKRFITLGSPLAIRAVADRLPRYLAPVNVSSWHNHYDEVDIVALNPLLRPPLQSRCDISNMTNYTNTTDNHHGIIGYLSLHDVATDVCLSA